MRGQDRDRKGDAGAALSWTGVAVAAGLSAVLAYLLSVPLKPFPAPVGRLLFFAFGPLSVISAVAFYQALRGTARPIPLLLGSTLAAVGGVVVNLMAVVQATQFTVLGRRISGAPDEATAEALTRILWGVNVVQSGLDVCWDIFASLGTVFLAIAILDRLRFGWVLPWAGVAAAVGALSFNLYAFPTAPADAGLVDLGPAVGIWYLVVLVQLWRSRRALGKPGAGPSRAGDARMHG